MTTERKLFLAIEQMATDRGLMLDTGPGATVGIPIKGGNTFRVKMPCLLASCLEVAPKLVLATIPRVTVAIPIKARGGRRKSK